MKDSILPPIRNAASTGGQQQGARCGRAQRSPIQSYKAEQPPGDQRGRDPVAHRGRGTAANGGLRQGDAPNLRRLTLRMSAAGTHARAWHPIAHANARAVVRLRLVVKAIVALWRDRHRIAPQSGPT